MSDLACTYSMQCKYQQSERLRRHIANSMGRVHGFKHRETLCTYLEIVNDLLMQKNYREAMKIHQLVHATILSHIGTDDSLAFESNFWLSHIYIGLRKDKEADETYRKLLQISLNSVGPRHAETLAIMRCLASVTLFSCRLPEGIKLLSTVFQLQDGAEGIKWQDICFNERQLAFTLTHQRRYRESKALFLKAAKDFEVSMGPENAETLLSYYYVALSLYELKQFTESENILHTTRQRQKKRLGESHIDTVNTMFLLARIKENSGRTQEALNHYEASFKMYTESYGLQHPRILGACDKLGRSYEKLGRYEDALDLYHSTVDELKRTEPDDHPAIVKICSWIALLQNLVATRHESVYGAEDELNADKILSQEDNSE